MKTVLFIVSLYMIPVLFSCTKKDSVRPSPPPPASTVFKVAEWSVDGKMNSTTNENSSRNPSIKIKFSAPVDRSTVSSSVKVNDNAGVAVPFAVSYENADSAVILKPSQSLAHLTRYRIIALTDLKSKNGSNLNTIFDVPFSTVMDSSRKFPAITDDSLLTLVQKQTFRYFWDFAHPVSGLARERNTSGEVVTSGGSGFGIMAIVTAINRGFITRAQGLARLQTIVSFLKNTAQKFHGAFPHWLNGSTGVIIPFSANDNGADLVETSFLMQGLLTARQYFSGTDAAETALRSDINALWQGVEWDWFRRGTENVLYWHWSPDKAWAMNHPIKGWNESLITYVMAASSPTHAIPKVVYDNGWASDGGMRNGASYFGIPLPLGPPMGGPLFFAHYSFLGINPNGLSDAYANYWTQNRNHTLINYSYCVNDPKKHGYSDSTWGLTASDIPNGYTASSPTNDVGVIAPTAALSSFPYTPAESMKALKFFYYVLGDKLWKEYGFVDAFSLKDLWFANSFLAIDQGPIIVMIENHRSGLLWNLFMSCPEVKTGMKTLGFTSPHL
jgi:uncharacterized protein YceK